MNHLPSCYHGIDLRAWTMDLVRHKLASVDFCTYDVLEIMNSEVSWGKITKEDRKELRRRVQRSIEALIDRGVVRLKGKRSVPGCKNIMQNVYELI
jgi:hypothetical protein